MDNKGKRIFNKITTVAGCVFFGSWGIASVYYFASRLLSLYFVTGLNGRLTQQEEAIDGLTMRLSEAEELLRIARGEGGS